MLEATFLDRSEEQFLQNRISGFFQEEHPAIRRIDELDLSRVQAKLVKDEGWSKEQAQQATSRYKMFLKLMVWYPKTVLVPTKEIDEVWHCAILHTRQYARDCQAIFGHYLHHEPGGDQEFLEEGFSQTSQLFLKHFGIDLKELTDCNTEGHCQYVCNHKCTKGCGNSLQAKCTNCTATGTCGCYGK